MSVEVGDVTSQSYNCRVFAQHGFDTEALAKITQRAATLDRHIALWALPVVGSSSSVATWPSNIRNDVYDLVKQGIGNDETWLAWRDRLVALATDLGIVDSVRRHILVQSLRENLLIDIAQRNHNNRNTQVDSIAPRVFSILAAHTTQERQIAQFVVKKICSNPYKAKLLAQAFRQPLFGNKVVNQLLALFENWRRLGSTGLLYGTSYPYFEELAIVEQFAAENEISEEITAALRKEVIGLYHGLTTAYNRLRYLPLLLAPPDHPDRNAFATRLTDPIKHFLLRFLPQQLECTPEVATERLDILIQRGIYGMLEYSVPEAWPNAWINGHDYMLNG